MKLLWSTLIVEMIFFWSTLSFVARPNVNAQLLLILSLLVLLFSWLAVLVSLFPARNKQHRLKAAVVLLLAPLCPVVAGFLGGHVRNYLFYRDLPRMKEVVALIQNGSIPVTGGRINLPTKYESLAYGAHAYRDAKGALTVIFFAGGGFPVKHHCFLYRSDGIITPEIRRDWPSGTRKEKQWFEVSD
jgi:hypothetical protein